MRCSNMAAEKSERYLHFLLISSTSVLKYSRWPPLKGRLSKPVKPVRSFWNMHIFHLSTIFLCLAVPDITTPTVEITVVSSTMEGEEENAEQENRDTTGSNQVKSSHTPIKVLYYIYINVHLANKYTLWKCCTLAEIQLCACGCGWAK